MEVCIDDIVVKSQNRSEHTQHLEKAFRLMRAYDMKLNLAKCAFGVNSGKFLGFMVTQRRIKISSNQIKVVMETSSPSNNKELQHLMGRIAALGHFMACFTDKLRSFFLMLNGVNTAGWTNDCEIRRSQTLSHLATHSE